MLTFCIRNQPIIHDKMPFNPSSKEWWEFKEHTNDMGWTQSLPQQFGIKEPTSCMQCRNGNKRTELERHDWRPYPVAIFLMLSVMH